MMKTNFIFTSIYNTDLSANKAFYKELFNSIDYTGNNINIAISKSNSLGNDINKVKGDFYKLIQRSSNVNFFNNTVMIGITNAEDISNLHSIDNVYYLLLSGKPKQIYRDNIYIEVTPKELLSQINLYTQAHKNNVVMGLEEVLRNTTGNFSILLYNAPGGELYIFSSNKTLYLHTGDDSLWVTTDKPNTTELQLTSTSNLDNRTIYYSKVNTRFIFKQYYIDDPISKDTKYDLTCNYDRSIESFILPFILKDLYNPNKIIINADLCINEDQYVRVKDMFKNEVFDVEEYPIRKEFLIHSTLKDHVINYADYTTDQIEIDKNEHIVKYLNGTRYIPVFKKLQSHEILQFALYLNVPFNTFETNCNHSTRDKFGNYLLCGECESCKTLYKRFAQLGYTYDNMPIRFRNHYELDKIKITNVINNPLPNEQDYLTLRNKIIGVFPDECN